ncbi:MAG: hypothetical protein E7321_00820 [Clostridiales bacterium]|nr:hypothetical protein [Clostridiales bacterium]
MQHRLFIVEGLPCSGKSTTSAFIAKALQPRESIRFVDEGTGDHPADYEFHALAPAGLVADESRIVPLAQFSGELFDRLMPYKIYDSLPWETEMPLMLEKWRQFVSTVEAQTTYVFNCVLLQNPMCETMMRFGFEEETSLSYIRQIADIIQPLNPMVIYLKNDDITDSVQRAAAHRLGWLDAVIDYHVQGAYGRSIGAQGFDGYIACLRERQARELRILSRLPLQSLVLDNPQRNWAAAQEMILAQLKTE